MNTIDTQEATSPTSDFRQRFVFDELDARGCVVRLEKTCKAIQATHYYPPNLASVLNQFALAAALLRDSIKIDGSLTIQLRTSGAMKLIMADCLSDHRVRAIAEYDQEGLPANDAIMLNNMGDDAVLAITITPDDGERYQSIVPIEQATLGECLEDYFHRSEQLPTLFRFFANKDCAVGIALHALPMQKITDEAASADHFERLQLLLKTLTEQEALELSSEAILSRLFHEEACRLFEPKALEFGCECSALKSLEAIKSLGEKEVIELIREQQELGKDHVAVDCHFCFQRYEFSFDELTAAFS